jgi:hypothetical protein
MTRALRAFVSYRRNDAFMHRSGPGEPEFIAQLSTALRQLGFSDVFVDTAEIKAGDYFEGRIHRAILNCDLFIPLIGSEWMSILETKAREGSPDILERELATAFALEKDVVPLLIDGARMPAANDLPETIRQLAAIDGKTVASNAPVQGLVSALQPPVEEAARVYRLGRAWTLGYVGFTFAIWLLCAIAPNVVGLSEFGYDPWIGMATAWAGMFIWPVFFLPFIFLALHRPLRILVEATLNADSFGDGVKYALPMIAGTAIAVGMTISEISPPQVPWTIHPKLLPTCSGPTDPGPDAPPDQVQQYDRDREVLASYGNTDAIPTRLKQQFWMRDKCWPNAFFFLTVPLRAGIVGRDYADERNKVQSAFLRMLAPESKAFKGTDAPYSTLFPFYALAFFLMAWLLAIAILMAIIYAMISIRRPRDGRTLRVPSEDAFLCLSYGFVTLLVWVPFRMTTNSIKFSYYCVDIRTACGPIPETFMKDTAFGLAILAGYVALTVGMLWNHRRLLLGFIGTVAVCLIVACTLAVYRYHQTISQLCDYWQFWLAISLLGSLMLVALWYQYDPAIVRFKDFQEGGRERRGR